MIFCLIVVNLCKGEILDIRVLESIHEIKHRMGQNTFRGSKNLMLHVPIILLMRTDLYFINGVLVSLAYLSWICVSYRYQKKRGSNQHVERHK